MARMEPEIVDLDRWPELRSPTVDEPQAARHGAARDIRAALRNATADLGLRLDFPDGSSLGPVDAQQVVVLNRPDDFFVRIGRRATTGLAEGFMAGDWTTLDLPGVLAKLVGWLARHPDLDAVRRSQSARPGRRRRAAAVDGTDLQDTVPGELVSLYSDETMTTGYGMFASGARSRTRDSHGRDIVTLESPTSAPHRLDLGDAQRRAHDLLLQLAGVGESSRVIVAPPGWGELPLRAAELGANVSCVTEDWPRLQVLGSRFRAAGMAPSISLRQGSVEALTGQVDAVVVSHPHSASGRVLDDVAALASTSLHPGGRLGIQVEVGSDRYAAELAELSTWRRLYIDERSAIPLRSRIKDAFAEHHELRIRGRVEYGTHAAHTARLWRENFAGHGRDAAAAGFDAVYRRMWNLHLAAQQTALVHGWADAWQLLAVREAVAD